MKIGLLVSGNLGKICLDHLMDKVDLEFVLTDSRSDEIIESCRTLGITCYAGNPRNGKAMAALGEKDIDILLSVNYLFIIEKDLIELPSFYAINIHGSLLPKYRGRTPHVWAIINNEKETGVTAHLLNEDLDSGDIIDQIKIKIEPNDTGADILRKFENIYPQFIIDLLQKAGETGITAQTQDSTKATFYGKRTPEDGRINWDWQKERIYNWVRAISHPYPGAFTINNGQKIIIDKISYSDHGFNNEMPNGYILSADPLIVKTPNGAIQIESIRESGINIHPGEIFN